MTNTGKGDTDNGQSETKKKLHWLEIAYFSGQIVLAVVGIWALVIYSRQLSVMRGTLAEVQRSGEQSTQQVWKAIDNINWMARSMDWAQKTTQQGVEAGERESSRALQATITQLHLDQRAWLGVDNIEGIPTKGQLFTFKVAIKNTGKTPAKNVGGWKHCEIHPKIPNVQAACRKGLNEGLSSNAILNPGGVLLAVFNPSKGQPLQQDFSEIVGSDRLFYVYGCVIYDDVFKNKHWLTYCSYWNEREQGYDPCEKYNDTGDGPPPK